MKNFQKGFGLVGLLIILGLVIVGGGAYWYMKTHSWDIVEGPPTSHFPPLATSTGQSSTQTTKTAMPRAQAVTSVYTFLKAHPPENGSSLYCDEEIATEDAQYYYFTCSVLLSDGHRSTIGQYKVDKYSGAFQN